MYEPNLFSQIIKVLFFGGFHPALATNMKTNLDQESQIIFFIFGIMVDSQREIVDDILRNDC